MSNNSGGMLLKKPTIPHEKFCGQMKKCVLYRARGTAGNTIGKAFETYGKWDYPTCYNSCIHRDLTKAKI